MPRSGPPRSGADARRLSPRAPPLPYGLGGVPATRRIAFALQLVAPERPAGPRLGPRRRPRPTGVTGRATVADSLAHPAPKAIPLGGPTIAERARQLRAAHDASADDGQRQLLREIMTHFRAWCEAHALGDPFGGGGRT